MVVSPSVIANSFYQLGGSENQTINMVFLRHFAERNRIGHLKHNLTSRVVHYGNQVKKENDKKPTFGHPSRPIAFVPKARCYSMVIVGT
jgi:hypothetical protein